MYSQPASRAELLVGIVVSSVIARGLLSGADGEGLSEDTAQAGEEFRRGDGFMRWEERGGCSRGPSAAQPAFTAFQ